MPAPPHMHLMPRPDLADTRALRLWLRHAINDRAIVRVRPGEPRMSGGESWPGGWLWAFEPKRAIYTPAIAEAMAVLMAEDARPHLPERFQLAAMDTGGVPIALALQRYAFPHANLISVRKEQRRTGSRGTIDGIPDWNLPVVLVDDIVSTENTLGRGLAVLLDEGLEPCRTALTLLCRHAEMDLETGLALGRRRLLGRLDVRSLFAYADFDLHWEDYIAAASKPSPPLANLAVAS